MADPNIVFCSFNHIYDAALHSECPYCKRIKEEQTELSRSLGEEVNAPSLVIDERYDDKTELLHSQIDFKERDYKDDSTELIVYEKDAGILEDSGLPQDEDDFTELVYRPQVKGNTHQSDRPVLGWIVCNSGRQIGRSFEIVSGRNYICLDKDWGWSVSGDPFMNSVVAEISVDDSNGKFVISELNSNNVTINGQRVKDSFLRNYDALEINSVEFVFIELMTEFVKWGI